MKWLDLLKAAPQPPDEVLEVRPGFNAFSGKKIVLKMRIYRAATGRWEDVPDEVSTLDGERL